MCQGTSIYIHTCPGFVDIAIVLHKFWLSFHPETQKNILPLQKCGFLYFMHQTPQTSIYLCLLFWVFHQGVQLLLPCPAHRYKRAMSMNIIIFGPPVNMPLAQKMHYLRINSFAGIGTSKVWETCINTQASK